MKRARKDSGFALLLVFLLAAVIAINLYMELPRVAVESQRQKEQLLIARGEEYKRAILVFYKANQRWPSKIEDLESFNNRRFLRRRFIDPMTGTDEWKLIHINNGVLTDSVTTKPKTGGQKPAESTAGQYVGVTAGMFDTGATTGGPTGPNLGRRRLSDGGTGGGTVVPMDPTSGTTASNGNATGAPPDGSTPPPGAATTDPSGTATSNPSNPPVPPGFPPGFPVPPGGIPPGSQSGNAGQPGQPSAPGFPGMPSLPGIPGAPVNSQTGGVSATPYPTMPGSNGAPPAYPQPGMNPQGSNQAQNMIQQILSSPRPGGAPIGNSASSGLVIGGGIAGVASKADQDSIMVYNDHTNYKEWEFIFDPTKWRPPPNPLAGAGLNGTPASQIGNLQQTQIGTSVNDIVAQQNGTSTTNSANPNGSTPNSSNPNMTTGGGTTGTGPVIKQQ